MKAIRWSDEDPVYLWSVFPRKENETSVQNKTYLSKYELVAYLKAECSEVS